MDYAKAIEYLQAAELELRGQIASVNGATDYDALYDCLRYAQQVSELVTTLKSESPAVAPSPAAKAPKGASQVAAKGADIQAPQDESLPAYFLYQGKLWKIATRGKETDALYHKSVPEEDAKVVVEGLSKTLKSLGMATISSVENNLAAELPTYKIQITVMALVKAGALKSAGRGKYSPAGSGPVTQLALMDALERMGARPDLLERAGANV